MRVASIFRLRLRSLFWRARVEQELDEELRYHLERQMEAEIARGSSPEEARCAALQSIGGFEQRKEECRDMRGLNVADNLLQDTRFALRQLRRNPGFTSTAILMLALGMCASVAIFAFVDAALIKPLPYREPSRLVGVFERVPLFPRSNLSYLDYLDWKKLNTVFSSMDAYQHTGFLLSTSSGAQPALGARVSDGFFRTLGVAPVLGRYFSAGEDLAAAPRTVMLSYATWQKRYGGNPGVLGKTVTLDGTPNVVIGVLPRDFHFAPAEPAEFWVTLHASGKCELRRSCHNLFGVARLKDGVSVQAALANVKSIAQQLEKQYPDSNRGQGAAVAPLTAVIIGDIRPTLLLLLSGAGLLLLIACVNVASLLLVRSESRRREIAVRGALGASGSRLAGQFVTEGLVLVAAGSIIGLVCSSWVMHLLTTLVPADLLASMSYLHDLGFNKRVLAFAGLISLLSAVLFSITPSLHFSLSDMRQGLVEGSRGSAGITWRRLGSKLVVLELATAMVLLVGAGLLGKSFYRLLHVELGMDPEHLATIEVAAPKSHYAKDEQIAELGKRVISRVASLPGVKSVGVSSQLPVSFNGNTIWIRLLGRPYHGEHNEVNQREVSTEYFTTIGAKLLRGRYFNDADDGSKPRVVIINRALAKQYFPGEDPIGKKIGDTTLSPKSIQEVVGIVDDIREGSLDSEIWPAVYYAFNQSPETYFSVVVRASRAEQSLIPEIAAAVHEIDRDTVTRSGATMEQAISDSPSTYLHRSSAWLVGGFAMMALLLGALGLYGVVAYSVSQRTREIGVRMALGAQSSSVCRLILKEAAWLAALGLVIGLAISIPAASLIRGLLFGIQLWDAPTLIGVGTVLGIAALLASYIPARRAASVNPVDALRAE
jgi:predicted permease